MVRQLQRYLNVFVVYYPKSFADKQVKFSLKNKMNEKIFTVAATNNVVKYYKLPYIDHISTDAKHKIRSFVNFIVAI